MHLMTYYITWDVQLYPFKYWKEVKLNYAWKSNNRHCMQAVFQYECVEYEHPNTLQKFP